MMTTRLVLRKLNSKMKRQREGPKIVDILHRHEEMMDHYENVRTVQVVEMNNQLDVFEQVLQDKAKLTDAMANAVFKNHEMLHNVRQKEKLRRKIANGEFTKEQLSKLEGVDDKSFANLEQQATEHTNWLRRLKNKSGKQLNVDERAAIVEYIRRKKKWLRSVDDEFADYLFNTHQIVEEFTEEQRRVERYMTEQNAEMHQHAIRDAKRQCITAGPTPKNAVAVINNSDGDDDVGEGNGIMSWVPQSDVYVHLQDLQNAYLEAIGEAPTHAVQRSDYGMCKDCNVELVINTTESTQVCPKCGVSVRCVDNSLKAVPFGDPISMPKAKASYERASYFAKWKKQVSGELNSRISDDDWATIFKECADRHWDVVDKQMIRKLLKRLGMSDYYELAPVITHEFNNVPLIKFSDEENANLDRMFNEAMELFDACPYSVKQRTNFISYSYFFFKCCEMLGYDHYKDAFALLVGHENKVHHDRIWKWMCTASDGRWTFIPTV